MKKDKTNIIIASTIIFITFLSIPSFIRDFIYIVCALIVLIPALKDFEKVYKDKIKKEAGETFVENQPLERKEEASSKPENEQ